MPKQTERERLVDLEARQRKLAEEVERARRSVRDRYGRIVSDLAVESLSEREFRDLIITAIRLGGGPALALLKAGSGLPQGDVRPSRKTTPLPPN